MNNVNVEGGKTFLKHDCYTLKVNVEHGNKGRKRLSTRVECAVAWMTRYFNLVGDKMPHNKQIHLPSWETQKDVHQRYKTDLEDQGMDESSIVVLSSFYRIWKREFPHVIMPEVCIVITLAKC